METAGGALLSPIGRRVSGCVEREGERDGIERGLVLRLRHRDRQAPDVRLPAQVEERAALPLGGDRLLNEAHLYTTIEVNGQTLGGAVNQPGAASGLPVARKLLPQARLVKGTARGHRERVHPNRPTRGIAGVGSRAWR